MNDVKVNIVTKCTTTKRVKLSDECMREAVKSWLTSNGITIESDDEMSIKHVTHENEYGDEYHDGWEITITNNCVTSSEQ